MTTVDINANNDPAPAEAAPSTTQDEQITALQAKISDLTAQLEAKNAAPTQDPEKAALIADLEAQVASLEAQVGDGTEQYKEVGA